MNHEIQLHYTAACPYCRESHIAYKEAQDIDITIVCPNCGNHYGINLLTTQATKKRNISDSDVPLPHKLRCPYGCGYTVLNKTPVNTIISVMCPKCKRYFRAKLINGRTLQSAPQKKQA